MAEDSHRENFGRRELAEGRMETELSSHSLAGVFLYLLGKLEHVQKNDPRNSPVGDHAYVQ